MDGYLEITPERSRGSVSSLFRDLWRYRDLILLFMRKTFVLTYKQTVLGPLWLLLTPILSGGLFSVVFGEIAGVRTEGVPRLLFFLTNYAVWDLFSGCMSRNADVLRGNAAIFGKVYFPRLVIPVSNALVNLAVFLIRFLLIIAVLAVFALRGEARPAWRFVPLLPLILLWLALLGTGAGILASGLTAKYRDLAALVGYGIRLWMFVTPVVYPLSQLSPGLFRNAVRLNPVTAPVELFRLALLGSGTADPVSLASAAACLFLIPAAGVAVFRRVERTFVDSV